MTESAQIVTVVFLGIAGVTYLITRAIIRFNDQEHKQKMDQQRFEQERRLG